MHLSFGYLTRLPIPSFGIIPTVECISGNAGRLRHIAELAPKYPEIWLANKAIVQAYGLTPDDFEYILSTFPVFARKRPEFFAYIQQRIAEWKEEGQRMEPSVKEYLVSHGPEVQAVAEPKAGYKKDPNSS
jgi:hypothetical protein